MFFLHEVVPALFYNIMGITGRETCCLSGTHTYTDTKIPTAPLAFGKSDAHTEATAGHCSGTDAISFSTGCLLHFIQIKFFVLLGFQI